MGILIVANALAPYSHPYLADLWNATMTGGVRTPKFALWTFLPGAMQYAPYVAALLFAALVWLRGEAPIRFPAAMIFILAMGLVLLSQNAEPDGVALGVVMAFLVYDHLRWRPMSAQAGTRLPLMLTVMVFPLFAIGASMVSLALYSTNAQNVEGLTIVDRTQLRGVAVPTEEPGLLGAFSRGAPDPQLLSRARKVSSHLELSASE
jgi:hypothetical protein